MKRFGCSGIGPQYGKRATAIFASGDQTFFKVDESILTASMLSKVSVVADKNTIRKLFSENCYSNGEYRHVPNFQSFCHKFQ